MFLTNRKENSACLPHFILLTNLFISMKPVGICEHALGASQVLVKEESLPL